MIERPWFGDVPPPLTDEELSILRWGPSGVPGPASPVLVWVATSYDDGEPDEHDGGAPRLRVRHAYVTMRIDYGGDDEVGDLRWGFFPRLCAPSNLGDPYHWLRYPEHAKLQHMPRCPYCLAVTEEIARRLVERLGIVPEPPPPPKPSLLDRQRKVRCPKCRAEAGAYCVGGTDLVWTTQVHLARKEAARRAGFVMRRHLEAHASRKRAAR